VERIRLKKPVHGVGMIARRMKAAPLRISAPFAMTGGNGEAR
jgi:hypothetical protein